jgi:hypothetical protein
MVLMRERCIDASKAAKRVSNCTRMQNVSDNGSSTHGDTAGTLRSDRNGTRKFKQRQNSNDTVRSSFFEQADEQTFVKTQNCICI